MTVRREDDMVIAWMSGDVGDTVAKDRAPSVPPQRSGALKRVLASTWRGVGAMSDTSPALRDGGPEVSLAEESA
jgi:hypothetical protein